MYHHHPSLFPEPASLSVHLSEWHHLCHLIQKPETSCGLLLLPHPLHTMSLNLTMHEMRMFLYRPQVRPSFRLLSLTWTVIMAL